MKRIIKFRAWSKDTKEMIPWKECFFPEWIEDDTMIMMQYTGFKDTKGFEIYEGDILHNKYYGNVKVAWDEDGWYMCENEVHYEPLWRAAGNTNIVGNIHEHKNLTQKTSA